jgi:hypothetical protein
MSNLPDSVQFSVIRLSKDVYRVIVQDDKTILRSTEVTVSKIMDKLGYELEQLQSRVR